MYKLFKFQFYINLFKKKKKKKKKKRELLKKVNFSFTYNEYM